MGEWCHGGWRGRGVGSSQPPRPFQRQGRMGGADLLCPTHTRACEALQRGIETETRGDALSTHPRRSRKGPTCVPHTLLCVAACKPRQQRCAHQPRCHRCSGGAVSSAAAVAAAAHSTPACCACRRAPAGSPGAAHQPGRGGWTQPQTLTPTATAAARAAAAARRVPVGRGAAGLPSLRLWMRTRQRAGSAL